MIEEVDTTPNQPPCGGDPERWNLDHGTLVDWLSAIKVCTEYCPITRACRRLTLDQIAAGTPPLGLVQSGVVFTATGTALEPRQLVEYAGRLERRQAPGRAA